MLVGISVFCANLASVMIFPLIVMTLVALAIGAFSFADRADRAEYGSRSYIENTWRILTSIQLTGIVWAIYLLVSAVPTVEDMGLTREVTVLPTYQDAYDQCIDNRENVPETTALQDFHYCDSQALALADPEIDKIVITKNLVRTVTNERIVERRIPMRSTYRSAYTDCINSIDYNIDVAATRSCHNSAISAVQANRGVFTTWQDNADK